VKLSGFPVTLTDWTQIKPTRHPGETGMALWLTQSVSDVRTRIVEYTPGYLADHWCDKGHILFCMSGELMLELRDGRQFTLRPGISLQVADKDDAHRVSTTIGATLFIVD